MSKKIRMRKLQSVELTDFLLRRVRKSTAELMQLLSVKHNQEFPDALNEESELLWRERWCLLDVFSLTPKMQVLYLEYWSLSKDLETYEYSTAPDARDICKHLNICRTVALKLFVNVMRERGHTECRIQMFCSAKTHKVISSGWRCHIVAF